MSGLIVSTSIVCIYYFIIAPINVEKSADIKLDNNVDNHLKLKFLTDCDNYSKRRVEMKRLFVLQTKTKQNL